MRRTYAVTWHEHGLPTYTGKLELTPAGLRFEGASARGRAAAQTLRYEDLDSVSIGRRPEERVQGRPTLLLERRSGSPVRIASLTGLGAIREIADSVKASVADESPGAASARTAERPPARRLWDASSS